MSGLQETVIECIFLVSAKLQCKELRQMTSDVVSDRDNEEKRDARDEF